MTPQGMSFALSLNCQGKALISYRMAPKAQVTCKGALRRKAFKFMQNIPYFRLLHRGP